MTEDCFVSVGSLKGEHPWQQNKSWLLSSSNSM
jgi:hypothetical protein